MPQDSGVPPEPNRIKRTTTRRYRWRRRVERYRLDRAIRKSTRSGNLDGTRQAIARVLSHDPASRAAFDACSRMLDVEGDSQAAARALRGRLSPDLQADLWPDAAPVVRSIDGFRTLTLAPSSRYPVRSPAAYRTSALAPYASGPLRAPIACVAVIENATLWYDGTNAIVHDSNGAVVHEASTGNVIPAVIARRRTPVRAVSGDSVLLGTAGSGNYFHWLTDVLPRTVLVRRSDDFEAGATWIVPAIKHDFQRETLALAGVEPDRVHESDRHGRHLRLERLYVPMLDNRLALHAATWQFDGVTGLFGVDRQTPLTEPGRRLFVSRDQHGSGRRCITNLPAVHELVRYFGFEVCLPDRLSVAEQAQLFNQASIVVGPHGAGLANLIFCKPGTKVLELHGAYLEPCYWAISEIGGLHYDAMECTSGRTVPVPDSRSHDQLRHADLDVPLDRLRQRLRAFGQESSPFIQTSDALRMLS